MRGLGLILAVRSAAVFVVTAAVVAPGAAPLKDGPPEQPRKKASLLRRRKWDWGTASMESLTEWGIVLRRYQMVDVELNSLLTQFSMAQQVAISQQLPGAGASSSSSLAEERPQLLTKVARLGKHLKAALEDQEVSDSTFTNMELDPKLSAADHDTLRVEHAQEVNGAEALAELGEQARKDAEALVSNIGATTNQTTARTKLGDGHREGEASQSLLLDRLAKSIEAFSSRRKAFEKAQESSGRGLSNHSTTARDVAVSRNQTSVAVVAAPVMNSTAKMAVINRTDHRT